MTFDFIVIGSGLAGLTSALTLKKKGRVLLISKSKLEICATDLAQGGIAAVVESGDSFENHIQDTLVAGANYNNKKAVEYVVKHAPRAIDWLEFQGVRFEKKNSHFVPTREAAHSFSRVLHATDFTGREIEKALIQKVKQEKNITVWENCFVTELIVKENKCYGIKCYFKEIDTSSFQVARIQGFLEGGRDVRHTGSDPELVEGCMKSKITILATGGLGQLYEWTTNPSIATGDGIAMAYRAGAKVKDLEFIQFHPTALRDGKSPLFLLSEALRGERAHLVRIKNLELRIKNKDGERFMDKYDKKLELAPRDIVTRAIYNEQQKGFQVYLDIRHKGKEFLDRRFPNISRELKKRGFDLAKDLIPVTPAAHYSCGGIEVDLFGRTSIENLFAFGEVSCSGLHGANRLASNSLLEAVVLPLRLKELSVIPTDPDLIGRVEESFLSNSDFITHFHGSIHESKGNKKFQEDISRTKKIKTALQHLMWKKVGIVRKRKGMQEALTQIEKWEKELNTIDDASIDALELKNMIPTAKLVTRSALNRPQSLGTHFVVKYFFTYESSGRLSLYPTANTHSRILR